MGVISDLKNRMALDNALQFGKEFYGVDLSGSIAPIRAGLLHDIEQLGRPVPQAIFFLAVSPFLGQLHGLKRLEISDGALSLRSRGILPEQIWNYFTDCHKKAAGL